MYDVCIVGAGPVGLTLAAALSKSQVLSKIIVIDAQSQPKFQTQSIPNQRVISVTQSTKNVFQSLGSWDQLDSNRFNIYNKMIVDEQRNKSEILEFTNQEAHIIEYDNIVNSLQSIYQGEIQYQTKLESIDIKEGEYVTVNNQFQCKLIVGSDGNKSKVKETAKIGTHGHSYHQMGIVCTVERNDANNHIAYQRYLKNGCPLALLPLNNPYSSIVWTNYMDDYKYLMTLDDQQFLEVLNQQLVGSKAPLIKNICNKRMAFPLMSLQAERYISSRVALIGDAAHSMHPMAGQGLNMGVNDAVILANTIIKNAKSGHDIGALQSLIEFESKAKLMNYTTSFAMEFIKKFYETDSLSFLRDFGNKVINNVEPLKQLLIQSASKHPLGPAKFEWAE